MYSAKGNFVHWTSCLKSGNFGQLVLKLCLSWAICRFNVTSFLLSYFISGFFSFLFCLF